HPAAEAGRVGEEALEERAIGAAEDFDVRPAASPGPGDDVRLAVAIDVASGDVDPAGEARVVGEEAHEERTVGAAEDLDVRASPGPGAGDDVGDAVAVDVADGHPHAAGEGRIVGHEAELLLSGGGVEN